MYVFISCKLDLDDLSLFIEMKEAADQLKKEKRKIVIEEMSIGKISCSLFVTKKIITCV